MQIVPSSSQWLADLHAPRFLFFTGKGGVGKTSLSCATAIALGDQGRKTLLVSTDPASNLDQVLGITLACEPTPIPGAASLWAMNIDPRQAAAAYRERVVGPYRGVLPDAAVSGIEEQLSGACTVEIAAFDAFSRLMTDEARIAGFDHVVFDTAPTGHTLRLLQLPAAWKGFLDSAKAEASCLGPLSGLGSHRDQFAATVQALADPHRTRLVLVARPDHHALAEAERTSQELAKLGVKNQMLAINGILGPSPQTDATAEVMIRQQQEALNRLPSGLRGLDRVQIGLTAVALLGITGLQALLQPAGQMSSVPDVAESSPDDPADTLADMIAALGSGPGVIMTMGKGGVGKTTMATQIASALAARGAKVHLTTSDPAAHLDPALAKRFPSMVVSRIDPQHEVERYRSEVMSSTGAQLDAEARRLLEEDLRSPCTEEIAVFRAFARVVNEAQDHIVVIDTAPTGHTILLLDATSAYHRDVSRTNTTIPDEVRHLLPRLRDPRFTRILVVALPEATPVQEGIDLQDDLRRAGIQPFGWIVNRCLTPLQVSHPVLRARRAAERVHLDQVRAATSRYAIVPWREDDLSPQPTITRSPQHG